MRIWRGGEIEFSCAHFYRVSAWSDERNQQTFGKCFTDYGHGHDYRLRAEGQFATEAEFEKFKLQLQKLRDILDHQHLNFVIPEFQNKVPTTENLAVFCLSHLKSDCSAPIKLQLWERHDLAVELDSLTDTLT